MDFVQKVNDFGPRVQELQAFPTGDDVPMIKAKVPLCKYFVRQTTSANPVLVNKVLWEKKKQSIFYQSNIKFIHKTA